MKKKVFNLTLGSSIDKLHTAEGYEATISYTLSDDDTEKSKYYSKNKETKRKHELINNKTDVDDFKKFYEEMNRKLLNYK